MKSNPDLKNNNLPHCDDCHVHTEFLFEVAVPGTLREELLCEECLEKELDEQLFGSDDYHLEDDFH